MRVIGKDVYQGRSKELFLGWEVEMASRCFYRCCVFSTHLTYSRAKIFTLEAFRNEVMGHIVNHFPLLRGK